MLSIGQALEEMLQAFSPRGEVILPLLAARGQVASADVLAQLDAPAFDNSAMDGYAVRIAELVDETTSLPVSGQSRAGDAIPDALEAGTAMRIFTGAPVPPGTDTVVMQENVVRDGDSIRYTAFTRAGMNVRKRGSDIAAGARCIAAGTIIEAGEIGMLASQGYTSVSVFRKPRVAIVCTGDELRNLGEPLTDGALYNSNGYALAAAVESVGAEAWMLPIARDNANDIAASLEQAFTADVVLCSGGVSVGDYDLVGDALAQIGVETRFQKVAMKPGKPLMFGVRNDIPFVGLPGNPVSAWVGFEVFVRTCLRKMLGHTRVHPRVITVSLGHAHSRSTGRVELARARFEPRATSTVAYLSATQGSGSLPSVVGVDGLVIFPAETARFAAGDLLPAIVLHETRGQVRSAMS